LFDIIIDENVTLENYCKALLNKVFELPQSKFQAFINYQTDIIQDELRWLNKFEKLISLNEELFISSTCLSRYNKMYHYIEKKREEVQSLRVSAAKKATPKRLINAEAEDRHFSFHEVKDHIEKINDFNESFSRTLFSHPWILALQHVTHHRCSSIYHRKTNTQPLCLSAYPLRTIIP
jgi:hypothetical protein